MPFLPKSCADISHDVFCQIYRLHGFALFFIVAATTSLALHSGPTVSVDDWYGPAPSLQLPIEARPVLSRYALILDSVHHGDQTLVANRVALPPIVGVLQATHHVWCLHVDASFEHRRWVVWPHQCVCVLVPYVLSHICAYLQQSCGCVVWSAVWCLCVTT